MPRPRWCCILLCARWGERKVNTPLFLPSSLHTFYGGNWLVLVHWLGVGRWEVGGNWYGLSWEGIERISLCLFSIFSLFSFSVLFYIQLLLSSFAIEKPFSFIKLPYSLLYLLMSLPVCHLLIPLLRKSTTLLECGGGLLTTCFFITAVIFHGGQHLMLGPNSYIRSLCILSFLDYIFLLLSYL
ncbi:hypothetical protein DFP73DRAFT_550798 [Morchella snyderi]|nr:hypothetical protein DFP73DRAFT_550798 [Morchella snyderi]